LAWEKEHKAAPSERHHGYFGLVYSLSPFGNFVLGIEGVECVGDSEFEERSNPEGRIIVFWIIDKAGRKITEFEGNYCLATSIMARKNNPIWDAANGKVTVKLRNKEEKNFARKIDLTTGKFYDKELAN